jgi:hypothetical protein
MVMNTNPLSGLTTIWENWNFVGNTNEILAIAIIAIFLFAYKAEMKDKLIISLVIYLGLIMTGIITSAGGIILGITLAIFTYIETMRSPS